MNRYNTKILTLTSMMVAFTILLSYVEVLIPIPIGIPGAKLGLANVGIVLTMYMFGIKKAYVVNTVRILVIGMLFGNIYSFLFSLVGSFLALTIMALLYRTKKLNTITISICGGLCHNIGQIIVACIVMKHIQIAFYLPFLLVAGLLAGLAIGIVSDIVISLLQKEKRIHDWLR